MKQYSEKADIDYMLILIVVMFWIIPVYEYLMKILGQ
jgi:hypothetical protein